MARHRFVSIFLMSLLLGMSHAAARDVAPFNPIKAIDRAALKSFIQRPLFDSTRRVEAAAPFVVYAPPSVEVAADLPPTLRLLGVIHGQSDIAIAQRDGQRRSIILRTGDKFDGWTVSVLPPVGIQLRNGSQTFVYRLFASPSVTGSTAIESVDGSRSNTAMYTHRMSESFSGFK